MTILEQLFDGGINPMERFVKRNPRVDNLVELIERNEETLKSTLTEKQKETLEKLLDAESELSSLTERNAFRTGFILAVRIMVEVMDGLQEIDDI